MCESVLVATMNVSKTLLPAAASKRHTGVVPWAETNS
jgi:hypothetical protein